MHALIETAATRAEGEVDLLMPGYTHLQKAQVTPQHEHRALGSSVREKVSEEERKRATERGAAEEERAGLITCGACSLFAGRTG